MRQLLLLCGLLLAVAAWAAPDPDPDAASPLGDGTAAVTAHDVHPGAEKPALFTFVRVQHGAASWNANAKGTTRFLAFLKPYLPCTGDAATVALKDLGTLPHPPLLYLYADRDFALTKAETATLHAYLAHDGMLFVDGPPDPAAVAAVRRALLPVAGSLTALPADHPVTTFLFALHAPGVGENARLAAHGDIDNRNFGAARDGRLIVFYSPGNLLRLCMLVAADAQPYFTAQYQMVANVTAYAALHGHAPATKQPGADTTVTLAVTEYLDAPKEGSTISV